MFRRAAVHQAGEDRKAFRKEYKLTRLETFVKFRKTRQQGGFVRNRQIIVSLFTVFLLSNLLGSAVYSATPNSCVACHTNEAVMKSLYKPPSIPQDQGEG